MFGRAFATQSFVSVKELKYCMLLLRNIGTNTAQIRTLTCKMDSDGADYGYNISHHVGVVVKTLTLPCPWARQREHMYQVDMGISCVAH